MALLSIRLLACAHDEAGDDSAASPDDTGTPTVALAPLEDEAIDYATVCADRWPDESCAEEPCDLGATEATYEAAWRDWVQPRWALTDAQYAERVDLWRADWDGPDDRLELAHLVSVGWHRAMLTYSGPGDGADPTPEDAAAYWESYDPAMTVPFHEPLVPYADVLAAAQTCADEVGEPLLPTGLCTTMTRRIADGESRFAVMFTTEDDADLNYGEIEVDLVTGEAGPCQHLTWSE